MFEGPVLEELRNSIAEAFDQNSLEQAIQFKLGKKLLNIVKAGALNDVVFALLKLAIEEGWVRSLVFAVVLVRPNNPRVKTFCEVYAPWAFKPPEASELISQVTSGIDAVTARLADPVVRSVVDQFGGDLRAARDGVKLLYKYKILHDQLHTIQVTFSQQLFTSAAELHKGTPVSAPLDVLAYKLRRHADKAEEQAAELPTHLLESRWVKTLSQIADLIEVKNPKPIQLDRAGLMLKSVLSESGRINSRMTEIVDALRLGGLVGTLKSIQDHLAGTPGEAVIQAAMTGLTVIRPRIDGLMREHDEWQVLDRYFTMAEDLTELFAEAESFEMEDRFPSWDSVHTRLKNLFDLSIKKLWSTMLQKKINEMAIALTARDTKLFENALSTFLSVARDRFVDVDTELLNQSRSLAEIAPALAKLVP